MPITLSTTTVLVFSYLIFASQIALISIYYPWKLSRRVQYVLENFPPARYPKLYPSASDRSMAKRGRLRLFRGVNHAIALVGLVILLTMVLTGYRPDLKGGDEIFVVLYAALQICPLIYAEVRELRQYRRMRREFSDTTRKASLRPRRLFDFVAPAPVAVAVLLYAAWVAYYLYDKGLTSRWGAEVYVTLTIITGINLAYIVILTKFLRGKKLNPYQGYEDQLNQIETIAQVFLFSSILISLFSVVTIAVDRYALEVLDPPLTSLYLQLCVTFGMGLMFRKLPVEGIDFEVYRGDTAPLAT